MSARHLLIQGLVQGVFFRAEARKKALELELTGWIRNLGDGSVEVIAEGEDLQVQTFEEWCRKGPPLANVENVEVTETEEHHYAEFSVRH